jgi:hypothetical protein
MGDAPELSLRPFGAAPRDVEVDLFAGDRPRVVTELLRRCAVDAGGGEVPEGLLWGLPVGRRTEALAALCALSGAASLDRTLSCPAPECGEAVSLALPLEALIGAGREVGGDGVVVEHEGRALRLRLPTGDDLRCWAEAPPTDAGMLAALAQAPLAPDEVSPALVAAAEEALAAADPLVDVRITTVCPACRREIELPLDLEAEALAVLDRAQQGLLAEVARLAGAFHWSEREVLELPAWRRRRYLDLLGEEEPS